MFNSGPARVPSVMKLGWFVPVAGVHAGAVVEPVIVNAQVAAAWLTVYVVFAIVSVPLRGVGDVLAAAVKRTSDEPPDPDAVIDSHVSLGAAVHTQTAGAVTRTEPAPPAAG